MNNYFKNSNVRGLINVTAIQIVGLIILFIFIAIQLRRNFEETILEEKRFMIKNLTQLAHDTLVKHHNNFKEGLYTEEEAKKRALAQIREFKYGDGLLDYIFVFDFDGLCMVHRQKPELEGKNLIGLKDTKGALLIKDLIDIAKSKKNNGFYQYYWPSKKDKKISVPKLSYATAFEPWNLMLGTGIYYDELAL